MATETQAPSQAPSYESGMKQTMIWLGIMIAGVAVVAYFYI